MSHELRLPGDTGGITYRYALMTVFRITEHQGTVDLLVLREGNGFFQRGESIGGHHEKTRPAATEPASVGGKVEITQGDGAIY